MHALDGAENLRDVQLSFAEQASPFRDRESRVLTPEFKRLHHGELRCGRDAVGLERRRHEVPSRGMRLVKLPAEHRIEQVCKGGRVLRKPRVEECEYRAAEPVVGTRLEDGRRLRVAQTDHVAALARDPELHRCDEMRLLGAERQHDRFKEGRGL